MSAEALTTSITAGTISVSADERVYGRTAILRTAYWFTDRAYVFIAKRDEHMLLVEITPKPATLDAPIPPALSVLAGEFSNQLLDYQLREEIEERTGSIRELLITKALFDAGIPDSPPGDHRDPVATEC